MLVWALYVNSKSKTIQCSIMLLSSILIEYLIVLLYYVYVCSSKDLYMLKNHDLFAAMLYCQKKATLILLKMQSPASVQS